MDPYASISQMDDADIESLMTKHFPMHSWFHADPKSRIAERRRVEDWLHRDFIKLGGQPASKYPCYFTVGACPFLAEFEMFAGDSVELVVSVDRLDLSQISFTFPDSFFSEWLARNCNHPLYDELLNGRVMSYEMLAALIACHRIPNSRFMHTGRYSYPFYIEAQVWDSSMLRTAARYSDVADGLTPPLSFDV